MNECLGFLTPILSALLTHQTFRHLKSLTHPR